MSFQSSRLPAQPNHIPTASMSGGTAVTTPLATRSSSGIETGRTGAAPPAGVRDVIVPPVLEAVLDAGLHAIRSRVHRRGAARHRHPVGLVPCRMGEPSLAVVGADHTQV